MERELAGGRLREGDLVDAWDTLDTGISRTVDVHIRRVRNKLGEELADLVATVRGVGYRFERSSAVRVLPPKERRANLEADPSI